MINFVNRFKIPTLLGLGLIILGLVAGLYLVLREQIFTSQAAPSVAPQNIIISNITNNSVTISFTTASPATSFVTYGVQNPKEQTALDDRDTAKPTARLTHYVTLKNLSGQTNYQYKIISGNANTDILKFDTSKTQEIQTQFNPIIGKAIQSDGNPVNEGIVYLSLTGATVTSALIKDGGNFLIPLVNVQKSDLSGQFLFENNMDAKLTISGNGEEASALIKLPSSSQPLPPIKLGQNTDLTSQLPTPQPTPTVNELEQYDLNGDGIINANDYATVSSCIGKKPSASLPGNISCTKADINKDGKIDQKDLDLISKEINNQ